MRPALTCLTLAALILAAPIPAPAQQGQGGQILNMQNADIRAFIQDIGRQTGTTYILDPRVQGAVTITIDRPLSRAQLQEVLFSTLRANGLVAIPAGPNTFRVAPDEVAATVPSSAGGARAGFTTRVFLLNTLEASDAAEVLRPLIGRSGSVQAAPGNVLVIADYADNLSRIQAIIDQIDQSRAQTRVIPVRNGSARALAQAIQPLVSAGEGAHARLSMTAVEASNAIVLRGEPARVNEAAALITELDTRAGSDSDIRVVRLQHANAADLLPVLRGLVGQGGDTPPASGGDAAAQPAQNSRPSGPTETVGRRAASITQFDGANALVISADTETQRVLAEVIRQLDVRRDQVLVEAIVVEVSDGLADRLGVQLGIGGEGGGLITNFPSTSPSLLGIAAAAAAGGSTAGQNLQSGVIGDLVANPGAIGGFGAQAGEVVFGAIINAVKSDMDSNLISTPSVLTLDNEPARFLVGQEVPITTGEALGSANTNPFRTIERRDVGVQLEVTPQINAGGAITLVLRQEVSSVAGPAVTGFSELAFNKRELETTVLVDDGAIVVLGGLLDQTDTRGVDRVPGLSNLPGIGGLFRSSSRDTTRRNLMVFIRARKVSSGADAQAVTAQAYDTMRLAEINTREDARSALEEVVRGYMRAAAPQAPAP